MPLPRKQVEQAARDMQVRMLTTTISRVVNDWPRQIRVPHDLQRAIAEAILDRINS